MSIESALECLLLKFIAQSDSNMSALLSAVNIYLELLKIHFAMKVIYMINPFVSKAL